MSKTASDLTDRSHAERASPEAAISSCECDAIRALDRDDYARSEIAFMFGCKPDTVARHADAECQHADHSAAIDGSEAAAQAFLQRVDRAVSTDE